MKENIISETSSYELSVNQKNQWYVDDSETSVFYNQIVIQLDSSVELPKLKEAIRAVIEKNETLLFKTLKVTNLVYPKQFMDTTQTLELSSISITENESKTALVEKELGYKYDISKNEPIRFCYVATETSKELHVRMYSFWADTYSTFMFCEDLEKALTDIETYKNTERQVVEYQNFSAWQNELFQNPEMEGVEFWKNYDYNLGKSSIPFINDVSSVFAPMKKQIAKLSGAEYESLVAEASKEHSSVELVLFARLVKYLKQFTQEKITIGYTPFTRSYEELNNTFGTVNKALPIVIDKADHKNDYKSIIKKNLSDIDVWADYFYINREKSNNSKQEYFNYNFEYINTAKQQSNTQAVITDFYAVNDLFDFKVSCVDNGKEISINLYYNTDKILEPARTVLLAQLTSAFKAETGITEVASKTIAKANSTAMQFSPSNSVVEMFAARALETPNATAIVYGDTKISYNELDKKSNQFANYIRAQHKISEGDAVAVLLDRSEWFVIAMLGILKTGAFYIPVDTNYPKERIQFIVKDSTAKLLVTSNIQLDKHVFSDQNVLIASDEDIYKNTTVSFDSTSITSSTIAYCIYTSGSTGTPKGCKITHGNLLNYIAWANQYYFSEDSGNWGLITSLSFDLTVTALYTSLTRGKKLYLGDSAKDVSQLLKESFANKEIDTLKLTPTHISILKDVAIESTSIKTIICGGEALHTNHVEIIHNIDSTIKVYNEYGPTETTVGCTVKEILREEKRITIGKPIANTQIKILNAAHEEVGIGMQGEIYVSGSGVTEGYIARPELTSERFIDMSGVRSYKTGDIGMWLPDGNIQYISRIDDQVKIRGYRIELGEIEKMLTNLEGVKQAIVIVYEEEDTKDLAAFLISENAIQQEGLRNELLKSFPEYMIPSTFTQITEVPVTTHGKVDKKELLKIREEQVLKAVEYIAPRTELEEKIATIWEKLFKKDKVGIKDDFFFLGGHSIKLIKLINHYQTVFDVKLELNQFFLNTTVEAQANIISASMNTAIDKIEKADEADNYPLSLMQRRLWLLSQNKERSVAYNMYSYNELVEVDEECFRKAIDAIIERHESLRTVFKKDENGDVRLWVITPEELDFNVETLDLSQSKNYNQALEEYIRKDSQTAFDLENGPLIKVTLIKKSDTEYVFYKNMHHIMADNWSLDVLSKEFEAFYMQYRFGIEANLEELPIQYKDYAVWQTERKSSEAFTKKKEYWLNKFNDTVPKMNLLFTKERPPIKTYNGVEFGNKINDPAISEFFNITQSEKGITPFMKALAIFNILLYNNSFQTDIVVGSPVAGRDNPQLKNQIGLYINTVPFRSKINVNDDFNTLLENIKSDVIGAYKNHDYPFDLMVEDLKVQVDLSRSPLFDVMLVVTHETENNLETTEEELEKIDFDTSTSKFDFSFYVELRGNSEIEYRINYNTDLFDEESMQLFTSQFAKLVQLLAEDSTKTIQEYCEEIKDEKTKNEHQKFLQNFSTNLEEDF